MKLQAKKSDFAGCLTLCVGYCDAWYLLNTTHQATAYTYGVYGWNADLFELECKSVRVIVCTGYRPWGESCNYLEDYERRAKAIYEDGALDWETKRRRIETLLRNWLRKECKTLSENKKSRFHQFAECFK